MATKKTTTAKPTEKAKLTVKAEPKAAAKVEEKVTTAAKAAVKVEEKVAPVKETKVDEKKAVPAKEATTAKKATASRKAAVPKVYIQYMGKEFEQQAIVDRIIEKYVSEGNKKSSIKSFDVYVKPEDNAAYYVINGQGDSISL